MTSSTAFSDFTRRYSAAVIDAAIIGTSAFVFDFLFSKLAINPGFALFPYILFRIFVVLQIPGVLYVLLFWTLNNGQTLGMRAMHIRVVDTKYQSIGFFRAVVRFLSQFITSVFGWLAYASMMSQPKRQTWQDRLSGTYVAVTDTAKPSSLPLIGAYALNGLLFASIVVLVYTTRVSLRTLSDYTRAPIWAMFSRNERFEIKAGAKANWDMGQTYLTRAGSLDADETRYDEKYRLLLQSAREEFKEALQIDPENPRIHAALGSVFTRLASEVAKENAFNSYMTAHQLDPQNPYYVYSLGVTAYNLDRLDEAYNYLTLSRGLNPEDAATYHMLGLIYQKRKDTVQARTNYEKALELYEKNNKKGQNDEMIQTVRTYLSELP